MEKKGREELYLRIKQLKEVFKIEERKKEVERLVKERIKKEFWSNLGRAKEVNERLVYLQEVIEKIEVLEKEYKDLQEFEILGENVEEEWETLEKKIGKMEIEALFTGEYDKGGALLSLRPGAGGVEACDWVEMLFRMYIRWCERRGFKYKVVEFEKGEVAGIKVVTIEVKGKNVYGWLKSEHGVHRLIRISPFDASRRRHTSFASCTVEPLIEGDLKVELKDKELKIETFRASGPGGQHVNTASTAVRITHLPTGLVVTYQGERSQYQNKKMALKILESKVYYHFKKKEEEKLKKKLPQKDKIEWGREIRSYIFHPYTLIKDHRTQVEVHQVEKVMDGDLDLFMKQWLVKNAKK